jgi:hypothetical protein
MQKKSRLCYCEERSSLALPATIVPEAARVGGQVCDVAIFIVISELFRDRGRVKPFHMHSQIVDPFA